MSLDRSRAIHKAGNYRIALTDKNTLEIYSAEGEWLSTRHVDNPFLEGDSLVFHLGVMASQIALELNPMRQ